MHEFNLKNGFDNFLKNFSFSIEIEMSLSDDGNSDIGENF